MLGLQARAGPALLGPRRRREVNYNERMAVDGKGRRRQGQQTDKEDADASSGSSSGSDAEGGEVRGVGTGGGSGCGRERRTAFTSQTLGNSADVGSWAALPACPPKALLHHA